MWSWVQAFVPQPEPGMLPLDLTTLSLDLTTPSSFIVREFNSLSVVFTSPSSAFVEKRAYHVEGLEEEEDAQHAGAGRAGE